MMHLGAKGGHRVAIVTDLGAILCIPNFQRFFLRLFFFLLLCYNEGNILTTGEVFP